MLTASAFNLLFLGVVAGLGATFVWMFWEFDQIRLRRHRGRFGVVARPPRQNGSP